MSEGINKPTSGPLTYAAAAGGRRQPSTASSLEDITEEIGGVSLTDIEKTPTQGKFGK